MKARSYVLVCLSIVVLQACGASRKLSEDKAKEKISELQLIHFKDKQIQVQRIVHAGEDQAVVEANVPLAFRLSKSEKHDWEINAIRLGDRDWIESRALLAALSEVRVRQTRESLQRLQEGIQKYRAKTGTLPDTSSIAKLTDALFPNYMPEVIRYDAWNHELTVRLKSENSCEIVSAGPDGILGNDDDLSSGST
jgi:Type II secretion system (T2SS), protein G